MEMSAMDAGFVHLAVYAAGGAISQAENVIAISNMRLS